jgi:cytoskeletal protein RodZ
MSESPGHKSYSAGDIERYHNGLMSASERHALEKAALEDPFLADALEGYSFTTTAQKDLEEINRRISQKNQAKNTVPFINRFSWIKIAALFLIVAGGGWLIFNSVNNKKEISQAVPVTTKSTPSIQPVPIPDSISSKELTASSPAEVSAETAKNITPVRTKAKKFTKPETTGMANKPESSSIVSQAKPIANPATVELNEVAPMAAMSAKRKETFNASSASRSRSFNAGDSNPGYVNIPVKDSGVSYGDTIRNVNVVLQPDKANNDIEIVELKSKHPVIARPSPRFETLEPAEGWSQFNDYIADNIKEPKTYKEKPVTGDVELAFDINQDGMPVNISVVRSLCTSCDKKAIELLRQGPTWKNTKDKKGKITFHF